MSTNVGGHGESAVADHPYAAGDRAPTPADSLRDTRERRLAIKSETLSCYVWLGTSRPTARISARALLRVTGPGFMR